MIYALPGGTVSAVLEGAASGLVGTIGVRIENTDGSTHTSRTTSGIVEIEDASGSYAVDDLVAPTSRGTYIVLWDTGGGSPEFASEELVVATDLASVVTGSQQGAGFPTFGDLQDDVDNISALALEPDERDALINEGHVELCVRSGWTKALREIGPTVTDQTDYTFPADVRTIESLSVGGSPYAFSDHVTVQNFRVNRQELRADGVWWISVSSIGARSISIYPTSSDGSSILAECVAAPAIMDEATDVPVVPPDFRRRGILSYVRAIALGSQEDDPDAEGIYMDEFERQVQRLRELDFSMAGDGIIQQQVQNIHF